MTRRSEGSSFCAELRKVNIVNVKRSHVRKVIELCLNCVHIYICLSLVNTPNLVLLQPSKMMMICNQRVNQAVELDICCCFLTVNCFDETFVSSSFFRSD